MKTIQFWFASWRAERAWKLYRADKISAERLIAARVEAAFRAKALEKPTNYGGIECSLTGRVSPF